MRPAPSRPAVVAVFLLAAIALVVGWRAFWFLTDDAYIAFRYVSSSHLGWGYTWNPPPFAPVEGYTSFLWVALLDVVWRVTGVAPPDAANPLGLLAGLGSLGVVTATALRMPLSPRLAPHRLALLSLVLLGTVTNRTFLAWTSSGLETSLFTLLLLSWAAVGLLGRPGPRTAAGLVGLAALLSLTRPDGLLFVALSVGWWLGWSAWRRPGVAGWLSGAPALVTVAHVVWRRVTYGAWLPNTYYAKHVAPWPEAGVQYLGSFLLEYAYWLPLGIGVVAGTVALVRAARRGVAPPSDATLLRATVALGLVGQFAYYTFVVGGDHFEYRVYQHVVPLVLLGVVRAWDGLGWAPRAAPALLLATVALGWPVPWIHWAQTKDLDTREETLRLHVRVAPHLPGPLRAYGRAFDRRQRWLIERWVGMRHQEHKVFGEYQRDKYPTREEGLALDASGWPAYVRGGVGVPGWVMPRVVILDKYGLNDRVVARNPKPPSARRRMAHDREPPDGYHACFRPNVRVVGGKVRIVPRAEPLTADEIRACEARFLARVTGG